MNTLDRLFKGTKKVSFSIEAVEEPEQCERLGPQKALARAQSEAVLEQSTSPICTKKWSWFPWFRCRRKKLSAVHFKPSLITMERSFFEDADRATEIGRLSTLNRDNLCKGPDEFNVRVFLDSIPIQREVLQNELEETRISEAKKPVKKRAASIVVSSFNQKTKKEADNAFDQARHTQSVSLRAFYPKEHAEYLPLLTVGARVRQNSYGVLASTTYKRKLQRIKKNASLRRPIAVSSNTLKRQAGLKHANIPKLKQLNLDRIQSSNQTNEEVEPRQSENSLPSWVIPPKVSSEKPVKLQEDNFSEFYENKGNSLEGVFGNV